MTQFARPDSDVTTNSWTASDAGSLFAAIDEVTPDDGVFILNGNNSNDACEVGLSDVLDPQVGDGLAVAYRYSKNAAGGNARNITVELVQGTTVISGQTQTGITEVWTDGAWSLTPAEVGNITDYTDLRIRVTASGTTGGATGNRRSVRLSWAVLTLPDPPTPPVAAAWVAGF